MPTVKPDAPVAKPVEPAADDHGGELQRVLETVADATARDIDRLGAAIHDAVGPLLSALEGAAAAHGELLVALRAADAEADQWARLTSYRQDAADRVIGRIADEVRLSAVGEAIGEACVGLVSAWEQMSERWPPQVTAPAPNELYATAPGDSLLHRAGKLAARSGRAPALLARRWRRLIGASGTSAAAPTRLVPVRQLVAYHSRVRLPAVVEAIHDEIQQSTARCLFALVSAISRWADDLLSLEHRVDRPVLHRPAGIRERWPAESATGDPDSGIREELLQIGDRLQHSLAAAIDGHECRTAVDGGQLREALGELQNDLDRSGIFLTSRRTPFASRSRRLPRNRIHRKRDAWRVWYQRAHNRVMLVHRLLAFRRDVIDLNEALLADTCERTLHPVFTTFDVTRVRLRQAQEGVAGAFAEFANPSVILETIRDQQRRTLRDLERSIGQTHAIVSTAEALTDPGRSEWVQIQSRVDALPGDLAVHEIGVGDPVTIDPESPTFRINLRRIATQALEPPWPALLRPVAGDLRKALVGAWSGTEQVLNIVKYNFGAALEVLESPAGVDGDTGVDRESPAAANESAASAEELASDALRRSVDVLDDLEEDLKTPWNAFADATVGALLDDWSALSKRVHSEDSRQERWVGFQTGLVRFGERVRLGLREGWAAAAKFTVKIFRYVSQFVMRAARRGRAAVGVGESAPEDVFGSMDAIAATEKRFAEFPLVYRRLFSFSPVTEAALLEGRARDLVRVRRHFERWGERQGAGVAVLSSPPGSGRTSLLNILEQTVFGECGTHRVTWHERVQDEDEIAAVIAAELDIELQSTPTLDELEEMLRRRGRTVQPTVCLIDNLEHLFLQVPGGCELIERFLIFLARTDGAVYWVATVGREAWQYLTKTAATAVGFVTSISLSPIDRQGLQDIILSRHERTGMEVRFAPPRKATTLMRQRLRRAKSEEARQAILRESFFDGVFKMADQQVALGLLYWLRSAEVDEREDAIVIKPIQPLDFSFLAGLDLTRLFALKAFVVQRTLTLAEIERLLRIPPDQGTLILESFLSLHLIEVVTVGAESRAAGMLPDVVTDRFRIRRLLLRPILAHLMSKRIVY